MEKKVIIIGAGPGGLQLAYYLEKEGIDYLVLEKNDKSGSYFEKFPIHRKLISINKVYTGSNDPEVNMRFDWNSLLSDDHELVFKNYTKEYFPDSDTLVTYLNDFSKAHHLKIEYGVEVKEVSKNGTFKVATSKGNYSCEYLVAATGLGRPYTPNIKNIELCKQYEDLSFDGTPFINKRVLILGKGNSALETADYLTPYASLIHCLSPNVLKMAWETHFVGHLRAVNNNFLDTYQLKSQNGLINGVIKNLEKKGDQFYVKVGYGNANGEIEDLVYDEVIVCTGFRFDTSMFSEDIKPALTILDKLPDQNSSWESKNVENLFFAGTVTQMRDYKKSTSGFIHGFRYNSKCLYHILNRRINDTAWEFEQFEDTSAAAVTSKIIKNVNKTSSLWQQFGFLSHVVTYNEEGDMRYYYDVPVDYLHEHNDYFGTDYFVITLEYGDEIFKRAANIFAVERVHKDDYENADKSAFLHPIIRQYSKGELITTHHIIEDFESKWDEEVHIQPLLQYLEKQLAKHTNNVTV